MADSSFDIVNKIDRQEVDNALNQAAKEIATRYDFKNTGAAIDWSGEFGIEIKANADERALAILDVFKDKLIKRGISLKTLDEGEPRASGKEVRISSTMTEGISQEQAKKVSKLIRDEGPKGAKVQIQGDELRVSSKKRDDLQEIIALPVGIIAAIRRYSFFDQFITFFSYVGYSMPTFWLGLMLLLIFANQIPILPVAGVIDIRVAGAPFLTDNYNHWFWAHPIVGVLDIARHLILPAVTIAIVGIAGDSRFMRASMLDTIHQDFVRTARAKGMTERTVVLKHALRNALLPVVTNIALTLPGLFSGAVVTESIFSWPGMGQLFFQALNSYDYPLMMGILFVSAVLVVTFNFIADVAYALIDPRISYA